jgi:hypothetical protein
MGLIPKFFPDCVVAIGAKAGKGYTWVASGFLYGNYVSNNPDGTKQYGCYLVTNKHVFKELEDLDFAFMRINPQTNLPAREWALDLRDDQEVPTWFPHPNPDIDVAVTPVDWNLLTSQGMQVNIFRSDEHVANIDKMNQIGVTEGDFVYVLGFPMGIVGGEKNVVIVRSGSVARIRDCLTKVNPRYLIDSFVFPGNSGGPVVLRPEAMTIPGTGRVPSPHLIGIVTGYMPYQDIAVSQQTGKTRIIFEDNSGLAAVHPIDYVDDAVKEHLNSVKKT